jgi:ethylbenzene hydroxylase subunit beta/complex iron-sulfur molybdoenzyme family reductase subunit beta
MAVIEPTPEEKQREEELAKEFLAIKDELRRTKRQLAMVMDLNKCIGCQLCSMACKNIWTKKEGREYMWWNTVNTMPGKGTPKNIENLGGGYKVKEFKDEFQKRSVREPILGKLPTRKEFGDLWKFNHDEVVNSKWGTVKLTAKNPDGTEPDWSMNWDEDQGALGIDYPNSFFFYLPRICNHCTYAPCIDACPRHAIYKREEDGVVLIDQDRCKGYRFCLESCPYKKIYFNFETLTSMKCIFCYPRTEKGVANACARQCTGRVRFVDYLDNERGPVHQLVKKWKVALPLFPQFGTEPNVFYVPPLAPPRLDDSGKLDPSKSRIPLKYMVHLFGPEVEQSLKLLQREMERTRDGEKSELMEILIAKRWNKMFGPFDKDPMAAM